MKAFVIALLSLSVLAFDAGASSKLAPICQKNPKKLWKFSLKDDPVPEDRVAEVIDRGDAEGEQTSYYGYTTGHLNDDKLEDLWLEMGECGTGGCMNGIFVACGDGKSYYPAVPEDYNEPMSIDKKNGVVIDGVKWYDLTYQQERENVGTLGWRYRFDGANYWKTFLASEYKDLMKKAKAGKQFARDQLLAVAYLALRYNPNDPDLADIKEDLMKKDFVKKVIADGAVSFRYFPKSFSADRELVMWGYQHEAFFDTEELPKEFYDDEVIAGVALKNYNVKLENFSEKIRSNPKLVAMALATSRFQLPAASSDLRDNRELLLEWSKKYQISSEPISARLKKDKDLALEFVKNDEESYRFFDESVRSDKEVAKLGLRSRGTYLYPFAPESIKSDKEILLLAAKADAGFVENLPKKLREDRPFNLQLVCANQNAFGQMIPKFKGDRQIAMIAAMGISSFMGEASKELQADRKFVMEVAKVNPSIYHELSGPMKADKEIATIVFTQMKSQLWEAPESIKKDPEIIALAAKAPPYASPNSEPVIKKLCSQ